MFSRVVTCHGSVLNAKEYIIRYNATDLQLP